MKSQGFLKRMFSVSVLVLLLVFSSAAVAQETTGGIQGVVKDPQGAVVPGAAIEATSASLIGKKTVITDSSGFYHIEQLPPGVYSISVNAPGFAQQTQTNLQLNAGLLPTVNITLQVGALTQEISVSTEATTIQISQSKVQTSVPEIAVAALPKARSFQSLIPLAPGARQEPLQGGRDGSRTNGFQIDGAADGENVYLIDGVNTTNVQVGGVGKNFQMDFVKEIEVKSSGFEAEYGGALGGVINTIPKSGSNGWHGEIKTYFETAALDANDPCNSGFTASGGNTFFGTTAFNAYNTVGRVCGQRLNPSLPQLNSTTRLDGTPEYYVPKKDKRHVITPGYEIGGPLFVDKLWLFSSYVPQIDSTRRVTTFQCPTSTPNCGFSGPREFSQNVTEHDMYNRLDYGLTNKIRLNGSWNYGYTRTIGQLPFPDSAYGQVNTGATTDPGTLRTDNGMVRPLSVYSFAGNWTPTSKLLVNVHYGYFFNNAETRGTPTGTRYVYDATLNSSSKDVEGNPLPASAPFNTTGFSNIPSNFTTIFDAYKRKSLNSDVSYFTNFGGTHALKGGYMWSSQYNNVNISANTAVVDLFWTQSYTPLTSVTACAAIQATNSQGLCQGQYGYFIVGSLQTSNTGSANAIDQALYLQDSWTVKNTGLTLNLGVRLDHEKNPAYDPKRFPDINFGWGDKVAPRLGGAYDLLHNGKVKVYASYGKYFDIMKLGLTRGSFGSDYWHECVYALDTLDYNTITPTLNFGAGCPPSGPAPGVTARFIENEDLRATKADPRDPAIQSKMKPVQSHTFDLGLDWAISPRWSLQTRYTRKRLDQTIEDMSITDNLGYYIGNPGSLPFADVLRRPTVIPCIPTPGFSCTPDANGNYYNTVPFCAECPGSVKANRRYDGLEIRLTRQATANMWGTVSYLWSNLRGNYSGLTDTDPTDANGGRHNPNNGRAFDIPTMTYLPNGKPDDGPLSTDRPHTAKINGFYRLQWFGQETVLGVNQVFYEGTPISSCLGVLGVNSPDSACQWAEGRGNFVKLHRDPATGNIVKDGVVMNARGEPFFQTDLSIRHSIHVSKDREDYKLVFEANGVNLLNQHAATSYYEYVHPSNHINPSRPARFAGDPQIDWGKLMNAYNYMDALNGAGTFAGVQTPVPLASRYGLPWTFQIARQFRFAVRFVF
jgi:hypothetical protein